MAGSNSTLLLEQSPPPVVKERLASRRGGGRAFVFYSSAMLLTGFASLLFADLLWRFGWSPSKTVALVLFAILFMIGAVGFMHGVFGFVLRRFGGGARITSATDFRHQSIDAANTVLVFPMHNEDARRVYEGLRATYESLNKTGHLERFDFFILSDSTDPVKWIEEEERWFDLVRELGALGRIYYRHRDTNEGRKSGNIRDFLSAWGLRYRYFVVFDADSVMRGPLLVDLVKLMEAHPTAGLIQTATATVGARTPFARIQQFANRFYGPLLFPALNYWAQDGGNYWGHNAIIRMEPFMQYCDLPQLSGKKPFGGQILSHDFIEAALMRKENWEVWFAWDLDGSYEEGPPGMIEHAKRDRRWCEGNLQHLMLLFARGFRGISRVHLTFGIFAYLSGLLWLCFLLNGTYMLWYRKETGLTDIAVAAFTPFLHISAASHALLVFGLSMFVILAPKGLSLLDLALDPERRRAFGGLPRTTLSVILETLFSALHAPIQMLYHTSFVAATILGSGVKWGLQTRTSDGIRWRTAFANHWWQTAIGLCWGGLVWWLDSRAFWWFVPVLTGMALSIPLSVFSSRVRIGDALRKAGLFLIPEEISPPPELAGLEMRMSQNEPDDRAPLNLPGDLVHRAVIDPYLNAVHVSLLRERRLNPHYSARKINPAQLHVLCEKLIVHGPRSLAGEEQIAILSDPDTMSRLHREVWMRPDSFLAPLA